MTEQIYTDKEILADALNRLKPISRKDADPYRICAFSFLIIDLPAKR